MSKRNQTILAIAIIIFVPAFIMFLIGVNSGKVPAKYIILFQYSILIIILLSSIHTIIMLYKEKSKLWTLGTIAFFSIFLWFLCPKNLILIRAMLMFASSILLLIFTIKLIKWQKNKNLIKK